MAIYVEREGIEQCVSKIQAAIDELQSAATQIDGTMGDITAYWKGNAADKAQATYAEEYKTLLTKTVPEQVDSFKRFIDECKKAIVETDAQLSGN